MFAVRSPLSIHMSSSMRSKPRKCIKPVRASNVFHNSRRLERVYETDAFYVLICFKDGLYSTQHYDKDELPVNDVVAFTTYDDACRYRTFLESFSNMKPRIECVPRIILELLPHKCLVVNEGSIALPPREDVDVTEWEMHDSLKNERWSVQEKSQDM